MTQLPSVAVLGGTGQQGRGLAQRFALAGLPVVVGSRDPNHAREVVAGWVEAGAGIAVETNAGAVGKADVVVLTVPFNSVDALLDDVRSSFSAGTLVIDVSVQVSFGAGTFQIDDVLEGSAKEYIRSRLPDGVGLPGTFKTLPAHLLDDLGERLDCDEFVCADSAEARARAPPTWCRSCRA